MRICDVLSIGAGRQQHEAERRRRRHRAPAARYGRSRSRSAGGNRGAHRHRDQHQPRGGLADRAVEGFGLADEPGQLPASRTCCPRLATARPAPSRAAGTGGSSGRRHADVGGCRRDRGRRLQAAGDRRADALRQVARRQPRGIADDERVTETRRVVPGAEIIGVARRLEPRSRTRAVRSGSGQARDAS